MVASVPREINFLEFVNRCIHPNLKKVLKLYN